MAIVSLLLKICKDNSKQFIWLSVGFIIILYLLPNWITNYFAIYRFKIYFPIFLLGYLICSYKEFVLKYLNKFLIFAIIIYLAIFKFYNVNIDNILIYYVISISAIIVLYFASRKIEKNKLITQILSFFGKYSLQIYLLQCICLNIGVGNGLLKIITIFISATGISTILAYITNKNKSTRLILYGG